MKIRGAGLLTTLFAFVLVEPLVACSDPTEPVPPMGGTLTGTMSSGGPTTGSSNVTSTGTTGTSAGTVTTTTSTASTGSSSTGTASTGGGTSSGSSGGITTTTAGAGGTGSVTTDTSTTGTTMIEPSFDTLKLVIDYASCAAADCHGGNEFNELDLRITDQLYTELTTTMSADCGNIPVLTPGNPAQSALVMLLKGPCGELERMPRGCIQNEFENNCVPDEYITAIEQWVAMGAPQQ